MMRLRRACENRRKVRRSGRLVWGLALAVVAGSLSPAVIFGHEMQARDTAMVSVSSQTGELEGERQGPAGERGPAGAAEGHEQGRSDFWSVIAKIVNAAILVGTLVYFLRAPLTQYLADRSAQMRQDLLSAAALRDTANTQIAEIDRRVAALPGEIEVLKSRGAEEIAAEEARILELAETERQRLLEQTRREIDLRLRVAERDLIAHASELAIGVAAERIKRHMTDEDQLRLVDRYVAQVKAGD